MTNIAIVGATGAVGLEVLRVLERRNVRFNELRLFASERSAGKSLEFRGMRLPVEALSAGCFAGIDIAIFSAGSKTAREFAPRAVEDGCVVIDNSSAFRRDPQVPLVVPEINGADIKKHVGIIANPNCTTAITLMALYPLHQKFCVQSIVASSYQAVSGAGAQAMEEFVKQLGELSLRLPLSRRLLPHQIAFNVFPQVGTFTHSGYTDEEEKMEAEGRRIMHHATFDADVTCVRVPVYRAHSVSVCAEFETDITVADAMDAFHNAPGLVVYDDPKDALYPTPLFASGHDDCYVGRIRIKKGFPKRLSFWVVGDQLLKGAALNAVQILEVLLDTGA